MLYVLRRGKGVPVYRLDLLQGRIEPYSGLTPFGRVGRGVPWQQDYGSTGYILSDQLIHATQFRLSKIVESVR